MAGITEPQISSEMRGLLVNCFSFCSVTGIISIKCRYLLPVRNILRGVHMLSTPNRSYAVGRLVSIQSKETFHKVVIGQKWCLNIEDYKLARKSVYINCKEQPVVSTVRRTDLGDKGIIEQELCEAFDFGAFIHERHKKPMEQSSSPSDIVLQVRFSSQGTNLQIRANHRFLNQTHTLCHNLRYSAHFAVPWQYQAIYTKTIMFRVQLFWDET